MKLVEPAIYELLKNLSDGRVYAMRAKQNSATPFIIFQKTDSERIRAINGPSGLVQAYIQVDCYDKGYYTAKTLAAQIETLLDGYRGTVYYDDTFVKIAGISLQNELDIIDQTDDPLLFRNTASYLVTYHQ